MMNNDRKQRFLIVSTVVALALMVAVIVIPNFIRARNTPSTNACINVLRQMDGAIQQWALENQKQPGDTIGMSDIIPYLKGEFRCPQGGNYAVGPAVSNGVTCSFPGHVLLQ